MIQSQWSGSADTMLPSATSAAIAGPQGNHAAQSGDNDRNRRRDIGATG